MTRYDDGRIEGLRIPPQSIEAEQNVIGGAMLAADGFAKIAGAVSADDFYRRDHQLIFQAIEELADKRQPIDWVTIGAWFEAQGLSEMVGGGSYLVDVASNTASAANIVAYAKIVKDNSILRKAVNAGTEIVNAAFSPDGRDVDEILAFAHGQVADLYQSTPDEMMPSYEAVAMTVKRIEERRTHRIETGSAIAGISTGIHDLDIEINGLEGGCLYFIGGRPGMGKSTLAQNIAEYIPMQLKKPADIFTYEMPEHQYTERMIVSQSRISSRLVRTGEIDEVDWAEFRRAANRVSAAPWCIGMPKTRDARYIFNQSRRAHARKKRGVIIVDYLQLLTFPGAENRNGEISKITGGLKQLAINLNVPVVVLSQLSRDIEKRADKRPMLSDLRDSGSIEQDADVVMFLYRDDYYNKESRYAGTAEIIIAKQRNGEAGRTVRVGCDLSRFRFSQLSMDWEPLRLESAPSGSTSATRASGFGRRKKPGEQRDAAAGE